MGRVAGHKENCPCPACKDKKNRITIRLTPDTDNRLEELSLRAGMNKTEVIELMLHQILYKGESP